MRIVMINTRDIKGGASKVAYSLAKELEKRGNDTDIFVGKKISDDPHVHLISKTNIIFKKIKELTGKDFPRKWREFAQYIKNTRIDGFNMDGLISHPAFKKSKILHCHNLQDNYFNLSSLINFSQKKEIIWTLHDMWAITDGCAHTSNIPNENGFFCCESNTKKSIKERRTKEKIYRSTKINIVVPSLWLKRKVEQSILKNQPVSHIPNGIDTNIFKKTDKKIARENLKLPLNKKIILLVLDGGKDNPWKGWNYTEIVIEKFKQNREILFIMIGGINKQHKDNLLEAGYIEDEKILADYYSASDMLLFSSIAENFPSVILESMACGLPVVSFDVGGVSEVVEHKINGYLAIYKNIDDLIKGVEFILDLSQEKKDIISENSNKKIRENFNLRLMTDRYTEMYEKSIINR